MCYVWSGIGIRISFVFEKMILVSIAIDQFVHLAHFDRFQIRLLKNNDQPFVGRFRFLRARTNKGLIESLTLFDIEAAKASSK